MDLDERASHLDLWVRLLGPRIYLKRGGSMAPQRRRRRAFYLLP